MLQPRVAKLYVRPIEETAIAFVQRIKSIRDSNLEMPPDFLNEIHKWSLECKLKWLLIRSTKYRKVGLLSPLRVTLAHGVFAVNFSSRSF